MRTTKLFALATALGVAANVVLADGHAPTPIDQAIKARNAQMSLYSFNLGLLGDMAKGKIEYDADAASKAAANLAALSTLDQSRFWPQGSDNGAAKNTRALPAIWAAGSDAQTKGMALATASAKMAEMAGGGLEQLQAGMGDLGGACSACHKAYRAPAN